MKRYLAADMRSALRAIREEQGPDAVILSSRAVASGVEVCAAVDLELAQDGSQLAHAAAAQHTAPAPADDESALQSVLEGVATQGTDRSVGEELRSLRGLLEQQLAALAWNDFTRREPLRAQALANLANLGLDRTLALRLVGALPAQLGHEQAQRLPYALLARCLQIAAAPLERGAALALIGPPGSGKTTTLSKLAARYVLEQDAANLVIISTDDERLGSHEQLRSLGRVLGVRVETVADYAALALRVEALQGRCILIDTPGAPARDRDSAARIAALRGQCPALHALLVLPASAQSGVIEDAVDTFGPGIASSCALTRVDEAVSLGGVLSALANAQLPIAYVAEGPRIPEDLRPARAHQLVARAVELARRAQVRADDELLARRYGGSVNAAA
jgi:flagellar biosynthesis protein FlhF